MIKIIQFKNKQGKTYPKTYKKLFKATQTTDTLSASVGAMAVLLHRIDINKGNAFTLSNGKIKVLKSIKLAKITFIAWVERFNGSYALIQIKKNNTLLAMYMLNKVLSGGENWESISVTTIASELKENDIINLEIHFNVASSNNGTRGGTYSNSVYAIIEEIE